MLRTTTERDLHSGITTVRLTGDLTTAGTTTAHTAIGKAAAECPAGVIVDLSALRQAADQQLAVFATITREAQTAWGVPVLLCAAGAPIREGLEAYRTYVALYEHHAQASLALLAYVPRWVIRHLRPIAENVAEARSVVVEACESWGVTDLRENARLVTSELVSNAIAHAGTEFDVLATFTGRYLRIAVRDGSTTMPRLPDGAPPTSTIMTPGSGRGLRVVAATATHWGATKVPRGKIVWALFRAP